MERSHFIYALVSLHSSSPFLHITRPRSSHLPIPYHSLSSAPINILTSAVEVNVAIICGCLPSLAAYISRHRQFFSSLRSHIRLGSVSFRKHSYKSSKQSPSKELIGAESPASTEEDTRYDPITLGSAVYYDGRFLKTVDGTQFVRSQDLGGAEHGPRSEEHHLEKATLKQTTRNVYEMRSFPGGAVDDKDFTHPGAVV